MTIGKLDNIYSFLFRYALLTKETWPSWPGDPKKGCIHILKNSQVAQDEYQMGKSKVFVKAPESVIFCTFLLYYPLLKAFEKLLQCFNFVL